MFRQPVTLQYLTKYSCYYVPVRRGHVLLQGGQWLNFQRFQVGNFPSKESPRIYHHQAS